MIYQESRPSKHTAHIIDTFWTFSGNNESERFKILPDSCVDLIFDLNQHTAFVSGVMSSYQVRELSANSCLIGIRINTEMFGALSEVPMVEIKNQCIELSEIIPSYRRSVLDYIMNQPSLSQKLSFLESFVLKAISELDRKHDKLICSITDRIRFLKGIVSSKEVAQSNNISLRQLERRFKEYTGLTIKEFSNVIRFKNAKEIISNSQKTSLLQMAFEAGFFDHSHMNYEFNRIAGENPSQFR